MMYFRYKLKNNNLNNDLTQRSLAGIVLFKNRWKYSERELTELEPFNHLVDVQGPLTREEFSQKEDVAKRERSEAARNRGRELIQSKKEPVPEPTVESSTINYDNLDKKTKSQLLEIAKELGFTDEELQGKLKSDLVEIIEFELENRIDPL